MYNNNYYPYQGYCAPGVAALDNLNQFKNQFQFQTPMNQPVQSDMLWVLSEVEAQSYPVLANNSVILWDKNKNTVYIKSVNMQGVPSMRILDYTERSENSQKSSETHECHCKDKFVPMETYNALVEQIDVLRAKVEAIALANKSKTKKEETDNG